MAILHLIYFTSSPQTVNKNILPVIFFLLLILFRTNLTDIWNVFFKLFLWQTNLFARPEWFCLFLRLWRFLRSDSFGFDKQVLLFIPKWGENKPGSQVTQSSANSVDSCRETRFASVGRRSTFWDTSHSNVSTVNVSQYAWSGCSFKAGRASLDIYSTDMRVIFFFWNGPSAPSLHLL